MRLNSDRTLSMEGGRTLVLADLHLGYENALEGDGLHVPRIHTTGLMDELLTSIERHGAERTVLLGDIKHDFSRGRWESRDDIRTVISMVRDCGECIVVAGNHDNFLQSIISGLDIEVVEGLEIDGHWLEHGHKDGGRRPLVIGHEHPSVRIFDRVGGFIKVPCFVHDIDRDVVVLPAFSPMAPGNDLCNGLRPELFSPVFKDRTDSGIMLYGCTEIGILNLGTLEDIRSMRM